MQTAAGVGDALRRVSRSKVRALRRIGIGLAINLVLAFSWLLIDPLQYSDRTEVPVIVAYFVSFVLADSVTTNMFSDQAGRFRGAKPGFWHGFAVVLARNTTLLLTLGLPLVGAAIVLAVAGDHGRTAPVAATSVVLQVLVWLGISSIVAAVIPVARPGLRVWWAERCEYRRTAWRLVSVLIPYALLWGLVPAEGNRRRLPGQGAVHRRTPGAGGLRVLAPGGDRAGHGPGRVAHVPSGLRGDRPLSRVAPARLKLLKNRAPGRCV